METKEVYVKAHTRVIKQRMYRFVCKNCNLVVERVCFPSQPLYCLVCRPPKIKVEKKPSKYDYKSRKKSTRKKPASS
jgi:hypothetical protein